MAHLIPSSQIGGVETGVHKAGLLSMPGYEYRPYVVRRRGATEDSALTGAAGVATLIWECMRGRRPEFVITSLWKAHAFGPLFRAFGCTWIAYFHSARFAHTADRVIGVWAARAADAVIADARETASFLADTCGVSARVVPLAFEHSPAPLRAPVGSPTFVYVGRFVEVKRLDLVADLVSRLATAVGGASFLFVGPKGPTTPIAEGLCEQLGTRAQLVGPLPNASVIELLGQAHFSILMSDVEGLSMVTVEALQAGCVPIARPVGEIARYCNDDNAILVRETSPESLQAIAERVRALCADADEFARMSANAARTFQSWQKFPEALSALLASLAAKQPLGDAHR